MEHSDVWAEMHQEQIKKENDARVARERLKNELKTDDMIKIMFSKFIDQEKDLNVLMLGEKYLPKKDVHSIDAKEPKTKEICGVNGLDCIKCSMGPCESRKIVEVK